MAKKLESQATLTSFAPLSPESKSQSFSIRSLFFRSKDKSIEKKAPEKTADGSGNTSPELEPYYITNESTFTPSKEAELSAIENNRGMSGILGKIMSNIIDKKKKGLQNYKDSDFKQYWMPDSNCKECYDCSEKFTTFRRRHHCRICGQIFCWRCCSQEIEGDLIGYTDNLRVCSYCCKMVLSCVRSLDSNSCAYEDGQSFQENQSKKIRFDGQSENSPPSKQIVTSPARRKSTVMGFREEDIARAKSFRTTLGKMSVKEPPQKLEGPIQDRKHLKEIMLDLLNSVQTVSLWKQEYKDHHTKVILGCDIIEWLVEHHVCFTRADAVIMGQAFINAGLLACITREQQEFIDGDVLYKPLEIPPYDSCCRTDNPNEIQESLEPLWVKEIQTADSFVFKENSKDKELLSPVSSNGRGFTGSYSRLSSSSSTFYLDLDVKESKVSIFKSQHELDKSPGQESDYSDSKEGQEDVFYNSKILERYMHDQFDDDFKTELDSSITKTWTRTQLKEDNMEKDTFEKLNEVYKNYEQRLLNQLLSNESLSLSWSDVVLPIIHHVVTSVRPDIKNDGDDMDIRQYVQFKKIPGGSKSESSIVSGIVFSKTVAHKKMRQKIDKPTVLLLSSSISYQRVENKLSSLDPILMQEYEYLKNNIKKLTVCKPNILLAEKTVSRLAQEMLLELDVTVALNVKPSVMERVARGTQAAIVSTIDAHLGRPQLGTCDKFRVKTYSLSGGKYKTLMFFDGCPENLGCTILLRGGSGNELKKVKQVVQFMIYVAYNWQLERSFLMDEFALFPSFLQEQMDTAEDEPEQGTVDKGTEPDGNLLTVKQSNRRSKLDETGKKLETESILDHSDPLHSYLQQENEVFQPESTEDFIKVDILPMANTFSKLLDDVILCVSLNVKLGIPYLETEAGKKCGLRKFFPQEIYWSKHFEKDTDVNVLHQIDTQSDLEEENSGLKGIVHSKNVEILSSHKFVGVKLTDMLSSSLEIQALVSDFRARGGMIKYLCPHDKAAREKEKKAVGHQREPAKSIDTNTSAGLCWEKKVDSLDPCNHQIISVLFSSYSCNSDNAPNYCVNPWVVKMEFYGANDITLGGFLDRYCFRSSYICPSINCVTPMTEHVRKFVHGSGCVHILLHELAAGVHSMSTENNIFMWSWCQICKTATPVVSMSQDTWSFSFAKYLELKFYAKDYQRRGVKEACTHSLHHDHYQYFAQNKLVAIFKYMPVLIWEVNFPAFIINICDKAIPISHLVEQIKVISVKGHGINSDLHTILHTLLTEYNETNSEDFIEDMINMLKLEALPFREKIEDIQLRLTSPTIESMQLNSNEDIESRKEVCQWMWSIEDQLVRLKCHIANVVQVWNTRIQEFLYARKKEQKVPSKISQQSSKVSEDGSVFKSADLSAEEDVLASTPISAREKFNNILASLSATELENSKRQGYMYGKGELKKISRSSRSFSWSSLTELEKHSARIPSLKKVDSEPELLVFHSKQFNNTVFQRARRLSSYDTSFTYMGTPGISAGLNTSIEDYDTYVVLKDTIDEDTPLNSTPKHQHVRSKSDTENVPAQTIKYTPERQGSSDGIKIEKKDRSVKTMLSQFLATPSFTPIEIPFSPLEHLLLPVSQKIPVIVHEEAPSSVIAYALASEDYEQKLQELKLNLNTLNVSQKDSLTSSPLLKHRQISKIQPDISRQTSKIQPDISEKSDSHFSSEDTFEFLIDSTDKAYTKPSSKNSNLHLEIQFSDNTTKFYCRIYYAEQFRKLRSLIFTEGEERFIRSLSYCYQWVAKGGKSGSVFCKTQDDRFILKQMPRLELQSFMDLAPSYFQYLNKAYLEQKPTILAKIVGIYRIGFKNNNTNAAIKMDLLVMENLFYHRSIVKTYDLKGSVRNRLVNTSGVQGDDIVLLDENLLKITCDNPFYIRPHSKTVLTLAISNDTQFLLDQSVMDYSLLVGLDEEKGHLIVGIIDYIRTFTWDKKVEMLIKSSGILGGHGKMPTVVSPELYRMRFCEAMDSYFLWVPDRWTGLGKGVDG